MGNNLVLRYRKIWNRSYRSPALGNIKRIGIGIYLGPGNNYTRNLRKISFTTNNKELVNALVLNKWRCKKGNNIKKREAFLTQTSALVNIVRVVDFFFVFLKKWYKCVNNWPFSRDTTERTRASQKSSLGLSL